MWFFCIPSHVSFKIFFIKVFASLRDGAHVLPNFQILGISLGSRQKQPKIRLVGQNTSSDTYIMAHGNPKVTIL